MLRRFAVVGVIAFALFGLSDSLYLAQHEASAAPLICNVQNLSGCNTVVSSKYSQLFGVPVAEFGVLFYALVFALGVFELFFMNQLVRRTLQGFALVGILMSLYSTFTQIFLIKALCIYCLASAVTTVFIFIFATRIEPLPLRKFAAIRLSNRLPMPPAS